MLQPEFYYLLEVEESSKKDYICKQPSHGKNEGRFDSHSWSKQNEGI